MSLFLGFLLISFKAQEDARMSSNPGDFFFLIYFILFFDCAGSSLLCGLFSLAAVTRDCCAGAVLRGCLSPCLCLLQSSGCRFGGVTG